MQRRLAAILAADVVGYSRLIREDEAGTLTLLRAHRERLIKPKIAEHNGRLVKIMGDGLLVEFASAVEAVRCAVEIQHMVGAQNAKVPEERRVAYRIGINIGDIVVDDNDIYGDGVNVASRLEGLAEPGGIFIARNVFSQVKHKLDLTIEHLGEREVKNIAEPVIVYRVVLDNKVAGLINPVVWAAARPRYRRWMPAALVLAATTVGALVWWQPWHALLEPASVQRMALPLPDKPSIAVLPFADMSAAPGQEYFADGMTEDLITDLSKLSGLFVIARNSSFSYKGRQVAIPQVAEELGVRYVLEGSVRRSGDQVRVNAQLIDALTGVHLWAERYDGILADVFDLQDKLTRKILAAMATELAEDTEDQGAEIETDEPAAYDAFLLGWTHYRLRTPESLAKAVSYFEQAIALDRDYGRAYAALGATYWMAWLRGWEKDLGLDSMFGAWDRADEYLEKAIGSPIALVHQVKSAMAYTAFKHEAAIAEAERALSIDPNDPDNYISMAEALIFAGKAKEAVKYAEKAIRLDPQRPTFYYAVLGLARYGLDQFEEAAALLVRAVSYNPEVCSRGKGGHLIPLIAAFGQLGRLREAKEAIAEVNRVRECPYSIKDALGWWPYQNEADLDRLVDGLRKAGVPE